MKEYIRVKLRIFAKWLLCQVGAGRDIYVVPDTVAALLPDTIRAVGVIELKASPDMSGEFKRHKVYGALVKKYPGARKSDLSLAIELALRALNV